MHKNGRSHHLEEKSCTGNNETDNGSKLSLAHTHQKLQIKQDKNNTPRNWDYINYLRHEVTFSPVYVCLSVNGIAQNYWLNLYEILRTGWTWSRDQSNRFWVTLIRIPNLKIVFANNSVQNCRRELPQNKSSLFNSLNNFKWPLDRQFQRMI